MSGISIRGDLILKKFSMFLFLYMFLNIKVRYFADHPVESSFIHVRAGGLHCGQREHSRPKGEKQGWRKAAAVQSRRQRRRRMTTTVA